MPDEPPSFLEQALLREQVRDTFRRTMIRLAGREPTPAELDTLVAGEIAGTHRDIGEEQVRQQARDAAATPPPAAGPPAAAALVSTWMTAEQLREAETALWFARTHEIASLHDALKWYVQHRHGALDAPPLHRCIVEFQIAKRCEGLRPASLHTLRANLTKFAREFGEFQPRAITPKRISDYLLGVVSPAQRKQVWLTLTTFFVWTTKMGYSFENPVSLALKKPKSPAPGRFILTPGEARQLLRRTKFTPEIGFWVLALFSGLRATEIQRIQRQPDPWHLINLTTGMITVPQGLAKTRGRLIPIWPNLRQWLRWVRFRRAPIYPPARRDKCCWVRAIADARQAPHIEGAPKQPRGADYRYYNIARRSFISYRLGLPDASFADVAEEAGNSEMIVRKYYQRRVTRKEALEYFSLTPNRV